MGDVSTSLGKAPTASSSDSLSTAPASASERTASFASSTSFFSPILTSSTILTPSSTISQPMTSSTRSSTSNSGKSSSTKHLSPGSIAGIGIGCAVIGAILTFIIMLLLNRKHPKSSASHKRSRSQRNQGLLGDEKDQMGPATATGSAWTGVETFLPQQADDAAVRQKVLTLFDQVDNHVDNFYHEEPIRLTPLEEGELSKFGTPALTKPLAALLETATRRNRIVKHCLAYYAVSLVTPSSRTRGLLPYELSSMLSTPSFGSTRAEDPNLPLALSRWRMLTAYLRPDLFHLQSQNALSQAHVPQHDGGDPGSSDLDAHALAFSTAFQPFTSPSDDETKHKHLVEVLRTALSTALWLLSQPATFRFDWDPALDVRDRGARGVVTMPGLLKTHDANGARLERPMVVMAGVTRKA